jgi:hypothetical protein
MPIVTISTALRAISGEKQGSPQKTLTVQLPLTREFLNLTQIKSISNQVHAFVYELFKHIAASKRAIIRM